MLDASAATVTPLKSLDLTRGWPRSSWTRWPYRPSGSWTGSGPRRARPGRGPARRRGRGRRRRGAWTPRRELRQGARAVRPADRAVPGRQAQVRPDARRAGAGPRRRCGTPPAPPTSAEPEDAAAARRRVRRPWSLPTPPCVRQGRDPDPRRHRLHLGARRPPLLPPRARPCARCSARRPSGPASVADAGARRRTPRGRDRSPRGRRARCASGIRAGGRRARASSEGKRAEAARWPTSGWVMPHLPRPWGRAATPLEQVLILQELRAARREAARRWSSAPGWCRRIVAYGTPEQQERFLAADAARRDDLVPAVQRARRRLRPRRRCR